MSLILDIIIILVMVASVVYGYKNGFFQSVMSLISGFVSGIVAYTFSPALGAWLNEKFFLSAISKGIAETFASAAKTTTGVAGEIAYDINKMLDNPQIGSILERFGVEAGSIEELAAPSSNVGMDVIDSVAVKVATPVSGAVSSVCAFLLLFVGASLILKVFTIIMAGVFKLPVLKTMDKGLGLVAGVATALFFGWILSVAIEIALPPLTTIAPDVFTASTFDNTIIIKFFAENSPVDVFSKLDF